MARPQDSKTGQFTAIAVGLPSKGTEAAGKYFSNLNILEQGLRLNGVPTLTE